MLANKKFFIFYFIILGLFFNFFDPGCNAKSGGNINNDRLDWFIYACDDSINGLGFAKVCLMCLWVILPDHYSFMVVERLEL